jgi:high-affinity Fe2+/Pb2+ permease
MMLLGLSLLLPIVRQVVRVRAFLNPERSSAEIQAIVRKVKTIIYVTYGATVLAAVMLATLIFTAGNVTELGRFIAWFLTISAIALVVLVPVGRRWLHRYLSRLYGAVGP